MHDIFDRLDNAKINQEGFADWSTSKILMDMRDCCDGLDEVGDSELTAIIEEWKEKPKRIQRKRTKGWRMPENTVYVGRPTKWGNPFSCPENPIEAVERFRSTLNYGGYLSYADITELRGKDLACWCRIDQPCHADVLLKLANEEQSKTGGE